ncbi:helix-hairpin-helix domain-containing protein [Streptococcus caviae]|uniref:helix-hairpin-helix domain-containing protein n=1 Tax=Streptococcus sp. 'caviae' TaxID=1915004 RepID=UPI00094BA4B5|nr:helix-hairpin-helix domain-containing protein [Streptococcus sp. 'caviae']OLN84095.1 competence protein CelA [Streptococcus sp. 'caviae']
MIEEILDKCRENKRLLIAVAVFAALGLGFYLLFSNGKEEQNHLERSQEQYFSSAALSAHSEKSKKTQAVSTIMVDVKGAVKKEGVYSLPAGSRVNELIEKAGGFSEKADHKSVNLAQKLQDEAVIYVASIGEDISVVDNSQKAAVNQSSSSQTAVQDKINLNTASLADLQTISGIGEKRAQDIIDYREANGGFQSVDDLENISGIGEKTVEKLKDLVSID